MKPCYRIFARLVQHKTKKRGWQKRFQWFWDLSGYWKNILQHVTSHFVKYVCPVDSRIWASRTFWQSILQDGDCAISRQTSADCARLTDKTPRASRKYVMQLSAKDLAADVTLREVRFTRIPKKPIAHACWISHAFLLILEVFFWKKLDIWEDY